MPTENKPAEPFQREDRYIVLKLNRMAKDEVEYLRDCQAKAMVDCVVVEHDWPEYHLVWAMLEHRMAGKPVPDFNAWRRADELQQRLNAADQVIDDLKAQVAPLSAIGELIVSQDNRCTDQPLFAVMEKRGVLTLDTHDHDRIEWVETESGDYCEADESKARRLEALHQGHRETPGWERYAIKDIDVFVTACFTEQGCKDFLERDGHNHRRPFIYAFGSYRNGEYQMVRNWLKSLREQAAPAAL